MINPIICEVCGKTFKNQNGLRLHSRVHSASADKLDQPQASPFKNVRVYLYDALGREVVNYPVRSKEDLELAELNARQRGYKIIVKPL